MVGFYLPGFNFSVHLHQSEYVMFCRQPTDRVVETPEEVIEVQKWIASNQTKYARMM